MKKLLRSLAALPLIATTAWAAPTQLTDRQMDKVTAGFFEVDVYNTGVTVFSLWFRPYLLQETPNAIGCSNCFLLINSATFSIGSTFGRPTTPITLPPE